MSVIALVSPKGGVGKTTIALTLAGAFAQANESVTLIDSDPNAPLVAWSKRGEKPAQIRVIADESEETIQQNIREAAGESKLVIVDLEGTANMRISYAVGEADLVLIPCKGSILDATEATKAIKLIQRNETLMGRSVDYAIVFSQVPAALKPRNLRDLQDQFAEHKVPILDVTMVEREAFRTLFAVGGTLHTLSASDVSGLENARQNGMELAQAVAERLRSGVGDAQQRGLADGV